MLKPGPWSDIWGFLLSQHHPSFSFLRPLITETSNLRCFCYKRSAIVMNIVFSFYPGEGGTKTLPSGLSTQIKDGSVSYRISFGSQDLPMVTHSSSLFPHGLSAPTTCSSPWGAESMCCCRSQRGGPGVSGRMDTAHLSAGRPWGMNVCTCKGPRCHRHVCVATRLNRET